MRLWPDAVRWRLTLWYSFALAAMLAAFAGGSFVVLREVLVRRTDHFLEEARDAFASELLVEHGELRDDAPAIRAALVDVRFRDVHLLVYDVAGRLVAETDTAAPGHPGRRVLAEKLPLDRRALAARLATHRFDAPAVVTIPDDEGGYQIAVRPVGLEAPYLVVAAQPGHPLRETLAGVLTAYLVAIPLFLALSGLGGYLLARRALAPVAAMGRQARAIGAANLHARLPVGNARDEIGELAGVVNDLLARLEGAFAQQRRFVADASHELRTPVAIVRAETEIALARAARPEREYRDALGVVQQVGERLSRVVDDLFLLARADAGHQPLHREPLYLDELTADTARWMRALAAQRSVRVELDLLSDAAFAGDAELIGRMLRNLLDNAVKYAPPGSAVRVVLERDADAYRLIVADEGPGIPAEAQPHVFERFFRAEKARSRAERTTTSGAGLGLAIARWIAEAHGGRLELVRSSEAGSLFAAILPAANTSSAITPVAAADADAADADAAGTRAPAA